MSQVSKEITDIDFSTQNSKFFWKELFEKGIQHLLDEQKKGFINTKHSMVFSKEIFLVEEELQVTDIFQRALILDTFIYGNQKTNLNLDTIIISELDYLYNSRRKDEIGAWSYFPDLMELPADVDDLAQILQAYCHYYPKSFFEDLFEIPIQTTLKQQANEDFGWESWILPKENLTKEQQLQYKWIHKGWGTGSDVDVVANFLYALNLYDKERFENDIQKGLQFLYNKQDQGAWGSTWYHGLNYGTFVSIKAIAQNNGNKEVISNALNFLFKSRRPDGGWGLEDQESDSLQTALALLGVSIASNYLEKEIDSKWLDKSLQFLAKRYTENEGWESCPFIKMPMGRPIGFIHTILTYESAPITTSFVTRACAAFF